MAVTLSRQISEDEEARSGDSRTQSALQRDMKSSLMRPSFSTT